MLGGMADVGTPTTTVPVFGLRHRLALALDHSGVSIHEMADELGVSRNTVGNYLAGRTRPAKAVLRVWAMRTGVPFEWLAGAEVSTKVTIDECYSHHPAHSARLAA